MHEQERLTLELTDALRDATRAAVTALFQEHQEEHFYYCSLITTGEGLAPNLTAWSTEALDSASNGDPVARSELKWSYADSPYYCYGEQHFSRVRDIFEKLDELGAKDHSTPSNYELKMSAMVSAMRQLDKEGLFGTGRRRNDIVVNVECMPPDQSNTVRAKQLNPPTALSEWLSEAAES